MAQVHQHHHAKFCRHPGEGDKAGPGGHRQMEPHPVEEPDPAHKGERHAGDNQQRFADAAERQIQQHEDNHQRHRHHQLQLLIGALQQLKLPGVGHTDARLQLHLLADGLLQIVHYRHHVAVAGIDVDPTGRAGVLGLQHGWSGDHLNLSHVGEDNLLLQRREDRQLAQGLRAVAIALRVADVDRIALDALHCFANHRPADGGRDEQLHVADGHPVAGRLLTMNINVEVAPADQPLG